MEHAEPYNLLLLHFSNLGFYGATVMKKKRNEGVNFNMVRDFKYFLAGSEWMDEQCTNWMIEAHSFTLLHF